MYALVEWLVQRWERRDPARAERVYRFVGLVVWPLAVILWLYLRLTGRLTGG